MYKSITIVTPVFNQVGFIEQTILSVLNQKYPNLEYIIIDGGSTDGTLEVIKKYETHISKYVSEPDDGMYDALNKGFILSSGEIMGWINSDDLMLPNSLNSLNRLFTDLHSVNWIQGLNSFIDLDGNVISTHKGRGFSLMSFLTGDFKWVQQESTFWRRSLWEKAGGRINKELKLAGDFELWFRFFQFDRLFNTTVPLGAWRRREGQLSAEFRDEYFHEVGEIIDSYKLSNNELSKISRIRRLEKINKAIIKTRVLNSNFLKKKIQELKAVRDIEIHYSTDQNKFI